MKFFRFFGAGAPTDWSFDSIPHCPLSVRGRSILRLVAQSFLWGTLGNVVHCSVHSRIGVTFPGLLGYGVFETVLSKQGRNGNKIFCKNYCNIWFT